MSSMTPSDTPKLTLKNLPSREHTVYMISSSNPATDGLPKLSKKNHVGIGVKHNKLHLYNIVRGCCPALLCSACSALTPYPLHTGLQDRQCRGEQLRHLRFCRPLRGGRACADR